MSKTMLVELGVATWDYKWRIESVEIKATIPDEQIESMAKSRLKSSLGIDINDPNIAGIWVHLIYRYKEKASTCLTIGT